MYKLRITRIPDNSFSFSGLDVSNKSAFRLNISYSQNEYALRSLDFVRYVSSYIREISKFSMHTYNQTDQIYTICTELTIKPTDYMISDSDIGQIRTFLAQSSASYFESYPLVETMGVDDSLSFYKLLNDLTLARTRTFDMNELPELVFE